jgi:hypothetical protein
VVYPFEVMANHTKETPGEGEWQFRSRAPIGRLLRMPRSADAVRALRADQLLHASVHFEGARCFPLVGREMPPGRSETTGGQSRNLELPRRLAQETFCTALSSALRGAQRAPSAFSSCDLSILDRPGRLRRRVSL